MKKEPRGLEAVFKITKIYYVTVGGKDEDDVWCNAENLDLSKLSEEDLGDVDMDIAGGFEYDSF